MPEHFLEKTGCFVRSTGGQPKTQVVLRAGGLVEGRGNFVAYATRTKPVLMSQPRCRRTGGVSAVEVLQLDHVRPWGA